MLDGQTFEGRKETFTRGGTEKTLTVVTLPEAVYAEAYREHGYDKAVTYSRMFGIRAGAFLSHIYDDGGSGEERDPIIFEEGDREKFASVPVLRAWWRVHFYRRRGHEMTHIWRNDHPNDLVGGITDAAFDQYPAPKGVVAKARAMWKRGFTVAAFSGVLRWRDPDGFAQDARKFDAAAPVQVVLKRRLND